ncbi:putative metal-dependent hydrolase of the TIM-barrel fold protein [Luteitalea pratensis]|uniref:Putative metal-dependent hydrolase of the TIM-barrel fold protein n=1 Tax=Luteitalea pratensis TaxID=1855912 RepID=A0A143PUN2_LUTPR|nr:amidohydrolase family protein [Luteitalea pratensis]AMY12091.1 putative metal-dependent hydrolase of the TIM-barrel fold protein [Luteitalea pratensis]
MDRRAFLGSLVAPALMPALARQSPAPANEWGTAVFDLHFHLRPQPASVLAHLDGAGITGANLLTRGDARERVEALQATAPGRFTWFASDDISDPAAQQRLTMAVKAGARGFGELKFHVTADGPELQRMYALAGELGVPILVHFQEVDHFPGEGTWATGYARTFDKVLAAHPKTTFIGHADAFWANISADYRDQAAYPTGPIVPGGVTDRWLADHPNLFADISANSGNNALSRDPAFTAAFLERHQDKLMFGSDCGCSDGHGGGVSQNNNPAATRMAGKCVARETLGLLKRTTTPAIFSKITWGNVHALLKVPA